MLYAAAMFLVYTILAALALAGVTAPRWLALALALVCVLISLRFGGVSGAFAGLPRNLY
jgi:hypothetical protein